MSGFFTTGKGGIISLRLVDLSGMAEDIIIDGQNGYLVDIEDADIIYNRACTLIENKELRSQFINSRLQTVINYNWLNIANQYYEEIYKTRLM